MGKSIRQMNMLYPEEKEGNTRNANTKLKGEIKRLKKQIKQLESDNRQLNRSLNKTLDFVQSKIKNLSLEEVMEIVDTFKYKETINGQKKLEQKIQEENEKNKCPDCGRSEKDGYKIIDLGTCVVYNCTCGYRSKDDKW